MNKFNLPVDYTRLKPAEKRLVREQYVGQQSGLCLWCKLPLSGAPPEEVLGKKIDWRYFPPGFLKNPIHLQHDHNTGLTEGAVHAYCNAVMWQYYGK